MYILVLNAGSSSQKSCLYHTEGESLTESALWEASIDWVAPDTGELTVESDRATKEITLENREQALKTMLDTITEGETKVIEDLSQIDLVGHRVVHGGANYSQPTLITPEVKEAIASLIPLAPSHNPAHLEGIETIEEILPDVPQIAVFDTAFHTSIPLPAKVYPIPYKWFEEGIQRYGFHGTSHQYCADKAAQIVEQSLDSLKIVTCHLGNGSSLAAIAHGKCIDTTMGFSPLEGLMMGTRSGSIDPQILIYLMQEHNLTPDELNKLLNKESGLQGVSGISNDMRTIQGAIEDGNEQAQLAFDMYVHYLVKSIGAMVASLEGIDVLVFTAGIGENNAEVRAKTCEKLAFLGIKLDPNKNQNDPTNENIATPDSKVQILVIDTEEDWAIANLAVKTISNE